MKPPCHDRERETTKESHQNLNDLGYPVLKTFHNRRGHKYNNIEVEQDLGQDLWKRLEQPFGTRSREENGGERKSTG